MHKNAQVHIVWRHKKAESVDRKTMSASPDCLRFLIICIVSCLLSCRLSRSLLGMLFGLVSDCWWTLMLPSYFMCACPFGCIYPCMRTCGPALTVCACPCPSANRWPYARLQMHAYIHKCIHPCMHAFNTLHTIHTLLALLTLHTWLTLHTLNTLHTLHTLIHTYIHTFRNSSTSA